MFFSSYATGLFMYLMNILDYTMLYAYGLCTVCRHVYQGIISKLLHLQCHGKKCFLSVKIVGVMHRQEHQDIEIFAQVYLAWSSAKA